MTDDLFLEPVCGGEDIMRHPQAIRRCPGVFHIIQGTAGVTVGEADLLVRVQAERHAQTVKALILQRDHDVADVVVQELLRAIRQRKVAVFHDIRRCIVGVCGIFLIVLLSCGHFACSKALRIPALFIW